MSTTGWEDGPPTSTGAQSITGLGFTPEVVMFDGGDKATNGWEMGIELVHGMATSAASQMSVWGGALIPAWRRAHTVLDTGRVICSYTENFDGSLEALGERLSICDDFDVMVASMVNDLQAGDHVVFMSNGSFGASRQKLTMALQSRRSPGT